MHKKGQFYIITVLIASFAIYTLVHGANTLYEPILFSDFDTLSKNYMHEAPIVLNSAIYEGDYQVEDNLDRFTREYLGYAQQKNPTLGLFYVYSQAGSQKVTVANYMSNPLGVEGDLPGFREDSIQHVAIGVGGKDFFFTVPVEISNFGKDFYSQSLIPGSNSLDIQVGGVVHTINYPANAPSYSVVVQSTNRNTVEVLTGGGTGKFIP